MANYFRNGQVKIANEILDQLAIRASEEINGVYGADLNDKKHRTSPKSTIIQQAGKLHVSLIVNLDKNVNVRKTVKAIQENVVRVIGSMTGLEVSRVNVSIEKLVI